MSKKKVDIEKMEFEEAVAELEGLVSALEDRNIKLKDAMNAFERGKLLHEHCAAKLQEAENRVRQFAEGELSSDSASSMDKE